MRKRKTHEQFKIEIKNKFPGKFEILGQYINACTKIRLRCKKCNHEWEALPKNLLHEHGCPKCAAKKPKKTHKEFMDRFNNPKIEILGKYIDSDTKIKVKCLSCDYEWYSLPKHLIAGHNCPRCTNHTPKAHEQFIKELKEINPNIEVLSKYTGNRNKVKVKCLKDGYMWEATPNNLLRGTGCLKCGILSGKKKRTKTHEQFVKELKETNPYIEALGKYKDNKTKIKVKYFKGNHVWEARPKNLLHGTSYIKCAIRKRMTKQ